ncbi:MAG: hypothetical protein ACYTGZ_15505 [Planctomycetota bacterium]|jgi:hypothetical protein
MARVTLPIFLFLVACGSGGSSDNTSADATPQTAAEVFQDCFAQDTTQFAGILDLLQSFISGPTGDLPLPEVDILAGLLSGGVVPYTWDLNEDGTSDASGSIRFIDEDGNTTIPFNPLDLIGQPLDDPASLIGIVPEGSRLELTFELGALLLSAANDGAAEGTLVFTIGDGAVSNASGSGRFSGGECAFDFEFDDLLLDTSGFGGYPDSDFSFDSALGKDRLRGAIEFDGTGKAKVRARLNDNPEEFFDFVLPDLSDLPDLPGLGDN